jgi:hypothetical protein
MIIDSKASKIDDPSSATVEVCSDTSDKSRRSNQNKAPSNVTPVAGANPATLPKLSPLSSKSEPNSTIQSSNNFSTSYRSISRNLVSLSDVVSIFQQLLLHYYYWKVSFPILSLTIHTHISRYHLILT